MNLLDLDTEHAIYFFNSVFMFVNFLRILFSSFRISPKRRMYHYLLSHISVMSSLSYMMLTYDVFTIDSNDHKVYNSRYFDWLVNTPIQLVVLGNIGQLTSWNIYMLVLLDILMILTGWIGEFALQYSRYIFFGVGMVALFPIYIFLFEDFDYDVVREFSSKYIADRYYWIGRYLLFVWLFYPIVWLLQNLQVLSDLSICIWYSVLDFFAKVVFISWVLHLTNNSMFINHQSMSLSQESKTPDL